MRSKFEAKKRMQKNLEKRPWIRKPNGPLSSRTRGDGLAEAAGEVRRGKPSGTGDIKSGVQITLVPGGVRRI